jgi:hypothetical protein
LRRLRGCCRLSLGGGSLRRWWLRRRLGALLGDEGENVVAGDAAGSPCPADLADVDVVLTDKAPNGGGHTH